MMKRITFILSALTFVLAFSVNSFAQTITASANVIKEIETVVDGQVDFAEVTADFSSTPSIDPTDGTGSNIVGTPSVARINIEGNDNEEIVVSFASTVTLTEDTDQDNDGLDELTYTPTVSGDDINSNSSSGGAVLTSTVNSGIATISGIKLVNGYYTLWFGGDLAVGSKGGDASIATGSYTGTVTVTVNYAF